VSRIRALEELPKRTLTLGENVAKWMKQLVHRAAMSSFLNAEVVNHCARLASEAFMEEDYHASASLLFCLRFTAQAFPALCRHEETMDTITEFIVGCRASKSAKAKQEIEQHEILTTLCFILSSAVSISFPVAKVIIDHLRNASSFPASPIRCFLY
jgi:hypothetical protein